MKISLTSQRTENKSSYMGVKKKRGREADEALFGMPVGLNGLHRSLLGKVSIASSPFRVLARLLCRPLSFPFIVSSGCPKVHGLLTVEYPLVT